MNEFLKVALTACIPAMTVIFGWGLNKGVSRNINTEVNHIKTGTFDHH